METGITYFLLARKCNRIKIGYTSDVNRRLGELQIGCPEKLHVILMIPGASKEFERNVHKLFDEQRTHGEWFDWDLELKSFVQWVNEREWLNAAELEHMMILAGWWP